MKRLVDQANPLAPIHVYLRAFQAKHPETSDETHYLRQILPVYTKYPFTIRLINAYFEWFGRRLKLSL